MRPTMTTLAYKLERHYKRNSLRSWPRATSALGNLALSFSGDLSEVEYADLEEYVSNRLEKAAPATVRYELSVLRSGLRLLEKTGLMRVPPFPTVRVDNVRKGFVEWSEVRRVARELPRDLADYVLFLAITGWRRSEASLLRWENVQWSDNIVRLEVGDTKNRQGREFPFNPQLRRLLKRRLKVRTLENPDLLFYREPYRPVGDFRRAWRTALAEAGLPATIVVHDLRRSAVRNLVRAGVPRSVAKVITGHRSDSVFSRYDIVDHKDLVRASAELGRYLKGR